jgi:enoyl-CoA hydratase/carnithine racemase
MDLEAAKGGLAKDAIWEKLSGAIADAPCLTIAVLNGTVAGGAIGMVLACDLRVAVPSSKVFYPVMKLGFLPQPSDPARLVALIGPAKAKLILMGGQKVDAETAASWGLIDRLSDDPIAEARALAADALGADRDHVTAIKSMFPS